MTRLMVRPSDKSNGEHIITWKIQFWRHGEEENFWTVIITIFIPIEFTPDGSPI